MPIEASPLSRPSVRESMEEMAPAEATSSSRQDVPASQQEGRKLTPEKHQDDRKADRAEWDKQLARADWQTAQQQAEEDSQKSQQHAQDNWQEAKQRAREDLQKAKQQAREALQTAQQRAEERFQLARRRARKDRHEADDHSKIAMERYEELSQVSSKETEKLECERNQAVVDRDRAIADKKQAVAKMKQALADKEQAMANSEQVMANSEQVMADREQVMADREQAWADRERAWADKEQALADRSQAIAGKEQAMVDKKQTTMEGSSPTSRINRPQQGDYAGPMTNIDGSRDEADHPLSAKLLDQRLGGRIRGHLARDGLCATSEAVGEAMEVVKTTGSLVGLQERLDVPVSQQRETHSRHSSAVGDTAGQSPLKSLTSDRESHEREDSEPESDKLTQAESTIDGSASSSGDFSSRDQPAFNRMCSAIALFPLRRCKNMQIQIDDSSGYDTRSIVRSVSRDSSHLRKPHIEGTEYWFRDVMHGNIHGQANYASADAVFFEIESFLNAGIRPEQITVLTWSHAQKDLIISKLGEMGQVNGLAGMGPSVQVRFLHDFRDRTSDIIIADLVMADTETDQTQGNAGAEKTAGRLAHWVKDPLKLSIGLTRARHGLVVVGQGTWLMRDPRIKKGEDKRVAELVRDAWGRQVYIRDMIHRDTHPNVVQRLQDLGSDEVSRRAAVADKRFKDYFERLIKRGSRFSGPSLSKKDKQVAALQRSQEHEDQSRLQQRAATRQEVEEDHWQDGHNEGANESQLPDDDEYAVPDSWEDELTPSDALVG